jgi:periplasmic divalent cation tolerance protein
MTDFFLVLSACGDAAAAERLAAAAVSERLAACAQILGPISSHYRWQGQAQHAQEWLCLLKTRADLYPRLEQCIRRNHAYQVPEIVALPLAAGEASYFDWMNQELLPPDAGV